ncbi:MAG TPA: GNAT family N-acetyltransferase [Chryseosolibacter sp.]|nr:GNAT family N-acetyltransferase [Chryseosolibacter sp.]
MIRLFEADDWAAVADIYHQGLETRNATFETDVPVFESFLKKFHANMLWVAMINDTVVGWAGLQPVSARKVYEGVAEVTVYIDSRHVGKKIGSSLMAHLILQSEQAGIWTLFASVFPENAASIHLHRSAGFREIGYREKIAQLDGKWRDTLLFERRSRTVGI